MGRAIVAGPTRSNVQKAYPELAEEVSDLGDTASDAGGSQIGQPRPDAGKVAEKPDKYPDRLFKYIPAEVVALYMGLSAVISANANSPALLTWIIFLVCLIGTPLYLWRIQNVRRPLQLGISTLAFVVWIFAIGGPFLQWPEYKPVYGALLLPIFTFFVAMIAPRDKSPKTSGI